MGKFFLFLPLFLLADFINFPYEIDLKKDKVAYFDVYYLKKMYPFKLRWTLYKNDILTILYRYDNFPRHITLYKDPPLNTFKIDISKITELNPYFYIEFLDFNNQTVKLKIYLKNGKKVKVDFKGIKWAILK